MESLADQKQSKPYCYNKKEPAEKNKSKHNVSYFFFSYNIDLKKFTNIYIYFSLFVTLLMRMKIRNFPMKDL